MDTYVVANPIDITGLRESFESGLPAALSRSFDDCDCAPLRLDSRGPNIYVKVSKTPAFFVKYAVFDEIERFSEEIAIAGTINNLT